MILPATDGKLIVFVSCLFYNNTIIFPCFCITIILFLKQESGLEAREIIQKNWEKLETNILFRNRGFILF